MALRHIEENDSFTCVLLRRFRFVFCCAGRNRSAMKLRPAFQKETESLLQKPGIHLAPPFQATHA